MTNKNSLTLSLFNAVISQQSSGLPEFVPEFGVFIPSDSAYAADEIKSYLENRKLSGDELNKTFYKSWERVQKSDRFTLLVDQIFHYMSTHGTNKECDIYIPDDVLEIPNLKLGVSVINAISEELVIDKCLALLCSGIALKEDTLNDVFSLLDMLDYQFTGNEGIRNKEANILIADKFKIYPEVPEEFLRYVLFKSIESTSLVKSDDTVTQIKSSQFDVSVMFKSYGLKRIAPVFNRFKPLFLAFKSSNANNSSVINKIVKLSKTLHAPMVSNPLNMVSFMKLADADMHWLSNATVYALFKALSACYTRMNGQDSFVYRVRNGKSWTKAKSVNIEVCSHNYSLILNHLKTRIDGQGRTVFIPSNITYALPTSEKLFVGNIPTGTKFTGKALAAGVYWKDSWGASDLDVSGLNIGGKIGWNANYNDEDHGLTYSGDLTSAPNGAVEYLHIADGIAETPTLVMNSVYDGDPTAEYKIIIGEGDDVTRHYMMSPNKVIAEIKTASVQKSTVLGMIMPEKDGLNSFVLLNFGAGNAHIAGDSEVTRLSTKALYQQWNNALSLNMLLVEFGFVVKNTIDEENKELIIDFNLKPDILTKSSFIDLFN